MNKNLYHDNIINQKFNCLTVLSITKEGKGEYCYCKCDCGKEVKLTRCQVVRGRNKSCGCLHQIDVLNHKFGRLLVLKQFRFQKRSWATCKCDCGNYKIIELYKLRTGHSTTCGCLKKEQPNHRKPDGENAKNTLIASYKKRAKNKNISFELTNLEIIELFNGDCHYCGRPPYERKLSKLASGGYLSNGIDRVDNSKGYVKNNVVSCCYDCNRMKLDKSKEYFIEHCKRITKHNE